MSYASLLTLSTRIFISHSSLIVFVKYIFVFVCLFFCLFDVWVRSRVENRFSVSICLRSHSASATHMQIVFCVRCVRLAYVWWPRVCVGCRHAHVQHTKNPDNNKACHILRSGTELHNVGALCVLSFCTKSVENVYRFTINLNGPTLVVRSHTLCVCVYATQSQEHCWTLALGIWVWPKRTW